MAELSRPARAEKEIAQNKNKKTTGQKHIHEPKDAKYMNWHSPFLWNQIMDAAKHPSVGYSMSASWIRDILVVKDPKHLGTFRVPQLMGGLTARDPNQAGLIQLYEWQRMVITQEVKVGELVCSWVIRCFAILKYLINMQSGTLPASGGCYHKTTGKVMRCKCTT